VKSANSRKRLLLSAGVIIAGALASAGLTAPTSAAAATGSDLQVSVVVTPSKTSYAVGDAITTTFVVTNTGTTTATNVHVSGGAETGVDRATSAPADQFDLAPGGSHSVPWAGTINQGAAILGYAFGGWSFTDDQGQEAQGKYRIAPVPGMTGTLNGKIFIDFKGNNDSTQPGLAGVTVTATNVDSGQHAASATTDNSGQFSMPNLAAGDYEVRVVGWTIENADLNESTRAQVKGGEVNEVAVAIVPGSGTSTPAPTATPTATATGVGAVGASASGSVRALPVTGSPTGLMAAIGTGLLLVGVVAMVVGRRRRDWGSRSD
jgi:LPXTG-motif cell wall-anchored protein